MAGATDAEEAKLLDDRLNGGSLWLALSSTTPADAGTGFTEPTGGGYARVLMDGVAGAWSPAVAGAPTVKSNAALVSFPAATADWAAGANLTHAGLFDAATLGTLRYFAPLAVAKPVLTGDVAEFAIGDIDVKLGDVGDPF